MIAHAPQRIAGQLARQAVEPVGDRGLGRHRLAEIFVRRPSMAAIRDRRSSARSDRTVSSASLLSGSTFRGRKDGSQTLRPERPGRPRREAESADTTTADPPGGTDAASPGPSAWSRSGCRPANRSAQRRSSSTSVAAVGVMVGIDPEILQAGTEVEQRTAKRLGIAETAEGRRRPLAENVQRRVLAFAVAQFRRAMRRFHDRHAAEQSGRWSGAVARAARPAPDRSGSAQ